MPDSKKLALLIGVSEYGEGLEVLSAPPKDVAAVKRVLENPELGGFDPANITALINPDLAEMRERIEELFMRSTKQDLVLFYFSGHGITDDSNRLYLTTKHTSKRLYRSRSVPASFIQNLSDDIYAKRQVIILDCCYSGAFAEGWQRKGNVKVELEQELGKEGRVVLTSSSSTQVSFQQESSDLSLYTQYFIEGIEEGTADKNQDGIVTVREVHNYARQKVQEVKPKMKPDIIVANDEGYDIILSKVKINAESRFRKLVEQYVDHSRGEIRSHRSQEILAKRAQQWSITVEQRQSIVASVLEPTRRRLKSLERYRQEYEVEVKKQYPPGELMLADLREWQQEVLGLQDSDVAKIQSEVNATQEEQIAKSKQQLERQRAKEERQRKEAEKRQIEQKNAAYAENLKRYEQEFMRAIDVEYPFSQYVIDGLRNYQQQLGLKEDDIAALEKPLREAKYQEQLQEQREADRRQQEPREADRRQQEPQEADRRQLAQDKTNKQSWLSWLNRGKAKRGDDLTIDLSLDLKEAAFGGDKTIKVTHLTTCYKCGGAVAKPSTSLCSCSTCNGSGQVQRLTRTPFGSFTQRCKCSACDGTGQIREQKCDVCDGIGRKAETKKLKIAIPAGVDTGTSLRIPWEGDAGKLDGPPGDLYVRLSVNEDSELKRNELDILSSVEISKNQADLGCNIEVKTLDGATSLQIPPGTKNKTILKLEKCGVPKLDNPVSRGDHLVTINVVE